MAKVEAIFGDAEEGLMLNEQGFVAECTGDNIFVVKDGKVKTPPSSASARITREAIFEIAEQLDIDIEESQMTRYDIYAADECFLTGTAAEVIAAVSLDKRSIGDGKPGPVTEKFISSLEILLVKRVQLFNLIPAPNLHGLGIFWYINSEFSIPQYNIERLIKL